MATVKLLTDTEAAPAAREVFDDIRKTRKTDFVNNAWRAQANHPDILKRNWEKAKATMAPGALDALTRISMQRLLERVWHDQGFTAILVTHDVSEAVALADRVLVIENGRIAQDINIDLPRPRQRGSADLAALEGTILRELLNEREEPAAR